MLEDDDMLSTLFGADNVFKQSIDQDTHHVMMLNFAVYIYKLKPYLEFVY